MILDPGSTLSKNAVHYYLPGKPFSYGYTSVYTASASASGTKSSGLGVVLITVINSNAAALNLAALGSTVGMFG